MVTLVHGTFASGAAWTAAITVDRFGFWGFIFGVCLPILIFLGAVSELRDWTSNFLAGKGRDWVLRDQNRISERFNNQAFSNPNFLCATVAGDEASWWLEALRYAGQVPSQGFSLVSMVLRKSAWALILLMFVASGLRANPKADNIGEILLCTLFGLLIACVFLQILMVILPRAPRAHRLGFGGESYIDNWLSDIRVSKAPNVDNAEMVFIEGRPRRMSQGLAHSSYYADTELLRTICRWMNCQCETQNASEG